MSEHAHKEERRRCICPSEDPRDCYTLRYYGIAGLGAPNREEDDGECECPCHSNWDRELEDYDD